MPRFKYTAMDSKGTETEGVIDAESQSQAIASIRSKGYFPTKVVDLTAGAQKKAVTAGTGGGAGQGKGKGKGFSMELKMPKLGSRRVKAKQLMVFTRQFATLIDAGLPLLRGLRILAEAGETPRAAGSLERHGRSGGRGSTFSEALAQYPKIFDKLFVNMVKAGEAGGVLEVVLNRLAEFMEKAERIKNKIKGAMVYPVVVLVAALGILTFMLLTIITEIRGDIQRPA